jgi:hypothetical protein
MPIFKVPEESEFLQHFSVGPEKSAPKDGYCCYEFKDVSGTMLRVSFNVHERSLQTILLKGGYEFSRVCQEGATLLAIINMGGKKVLRGECEFRMLSRLWKL